jgi:hypothetical protein
MTTTNRTKRITEVDYTKTSFNEIKKELVEYVKRHYPDTYKDFKKSSFGSLMFDLVSYVGDQLHYYLDHNANEAILPFTKDPNVTIQLIQALGQTPVTNPVGVGEVDVHILQPADSSTPGPDSKYRVTSKAGTKFRSQGGTVYTQMRDITFTEDNSQIVGYNTTTDGSKIDYYIFKAKVPVISGEEAVYTVEVGNFRRFLKVEIPDSAITEILKVEILSSRPFNSGRDISPDYRPRK